MNGLKSKGLLVTLFAASAALVGAQSVQVSVNGTPISFPDTQPQTVNGHVLVPLRGVFEAIGATVLWDPTTQSIVANADRTRVRLKIGDLEADINGQVVEMDTAPEIVGGSTLVPLRFLSQSLGASVDWEPQQNLVAITTRRPGRDHDHDRDRRPVITQPAPVIIQPVAQPAPQQQIFLLPRYTVIPMVLDSPVSSNRSQDGDVVSATVRDDRGRYLDLPNGTLIQGVVKHARPADDRHPGELEIRFTHVLLPNGSRYDIWGTAVPIKDSNITRGQDGRLVAKQNDDVRKNIGTDAAIGAGAGLVLGSLHARALPGAAIGGILGAIAGEFMPHHDNNVELGSGTKLGLILGKDLGFRRKDLH